MAPIEGVGVIDGRIHLVTRALPAAPFCCAATLPMHVNIEPATAPNVMLTKDEPPPPAA